MRLLYYKEKQQRCEKKQGMTDGGVVMTRDRAVSWASLMHCNSTLIINSLSNAQGQPFETLHFVIYGANLMVLECLHCCMFPHSSVLVLAGFVVIALQMGQGSSLIALY